MSGLSDILERVLREVQSSKKTPKPVVAKTTEANAHAVISNSTIMSRDLFYRRDSSDKEYHVQIVRETPVSFPAWYHVEFQYGRRGSNLITGTKTDYPVTLDQAEVIFWNVVTEKTRKGYR